MNKVVFNEALEFAHQLSPAFIDPYTLCSELGIEVITNKSLHKDGYLVCEDGCKLIFVSSNIGNRHRRKFIISHEIGHFLLHRHQLYCCSKISESSISRVNSSAQEYEANSFASEYLLPRTELLELLPQCSIHFSDISKIARDFDLSVTFSAIKAVQCSKTENEILLCYENQKLKWFTSADGTLRRSSIPLVSPIDFSSVKSSCDIVGTWETLYDGSVHQEIFTPTNNQSLILLTGTRCNAEDSFYEF